MAGELERSSCSRYKLDLVQNLSEVVLSNLEQEACKDGWTYSTEYFHSTVVTEVLNYCLYFHYNAQLLQVLILDFIISPLLRLMLCHDLKPPGH